MNSFINNAEKRRFEYHIDNATAFAHYHSEGSTLYIDYVEAPPELRGTGAAGKLMQYIVDIAQKENLKVVPICSYAAHWMSRNAGS